MSAIKVYGGDFLAGEGTYTLGVLSLPTKAHTVLGESIAADQLQTIEPITQENHKQVVSTAAGAAIGAVVAGPIGALVGALASGNRTRVGFVATFFDGRALVGATDANTFAKLCAASLAKPAKQIDRAAQASKARGVARRRGDAAADALSGAFGGIEPADPIADQVDTDGVDPADALRELDGEDNA